MPSKRSFFNATLFKKHLSRFWPLWGVVSLAGAMFPLYLQLALMQHPYLIDSGEFRYVLYNVTAYCVPGFTCAYAIFCVAAVWGYLYNARSVGLLHTLPVDRMCLFITNTLAAMTMQLIPFAITGALICLIALGWGFFDLVAVCGTVVAVLFCVLLFTGIGTLCAMLTGHAFALPAFYGLANFLAFLMEVLVTNMAHIFLIGVPMMEDVGRLSFLSPVVRIYTSFSVYSERLGDGEMLYRLRGLWVVALYALAGLVLLALSWFFYRERQSESAGDVVAFRWLRPIFRYGVALLSALTIGWLLYEVLWRGIFQTGDYADALPMGVCLFLGGLLGYYAASMLLAKSRRVFGKKSLPGVGAVAVGAAVVCLLVSADPFGLEKKIPVWDEIESVTISDRGVSSTWLAEEYPEQARALLEFHQAIVNDLDYIRTYVPNREFDTGYGGYRILSHYINLEYTLKDGTTLLRQYDLWMSADRLGKDGTYESVLAAFYQDPEVCAYDVRIPDGAELESIDIIWDNGGYTNTHDHANGYDWETKAIYAALQKDAREGSVPPKDILQYYRYGSSVLGNNFYFQIQYHGPVSERTGYAYYRTKEVYIAPSMTNTLNTLVELNYMTEEDVARWTEAVAAARAEADAEEAVWAEQFAAMTVGRIEAAG